MYNHIQIIKNSLAEIAAIGSRYLNEINDFPSISIIQQKKYINTDLKLYTINFIIRGYVMSDEDSTDDSEQLVRLVEERLNAVKDSFDGIRILSIDTDTGLLSPYGVCNIQCEAKWYEC